LKVEIWQANKHIHMVKFGVIISFQCVCPVR
jgi:hypothetical protein